MQRHGFIGALVLAVACVAFAAPAMQASPPDGQLTTKSFVSLKGKNIRLDYSLTEPGQMSLEIVNQNGKTLGRWNWQDSSAGVFFRDLSMSHAMENQSLFVLVSGPNLTSIQGLYTGSKGDSLSASASSAISQSIQLNEKPLPEDLGKGNGKDMDGKVSPYGP